MSHEQGVTEANLEDVALARFESLGYNIAFGPDISPDGQDSGAWRGQEEGSWMGRGYPKIHFQSGTNIIILSSNFSVAS